MLLLEVFALSHNAIKQGRVTKFFKNVLQGSDDEIQVAVSRLSKLAVSENHLVSAEGLTAITATNRKADDILAAVTAQSASISALWKDEALIRAQKQQEHIKEILQPEVHAQDLFEQFNKARVPGTGDWIRSEPLFNAWQNSNMPLLWVSGNPGAGKSFLSSNIVAILRERHPQGVQDPSRVSVGYYFFKDSNSETQSVHQALRDIAYQICQNDPVYAKYIATQCHSYTEIKTLPSAWRKLFVEYLEKIALVQGHMYIILDGIDEAISIEYQQFLNLLSDVLGSASPSYKISVVMVGRPHMIDFIADALEEIPTIYITPTKNSKDIVQYIRSRIQKSRVLKAVRRSLHVEIIDQLSERANGMFLWVDLMLQELYKKRSESSIRDALLRAPSGLTDMLQHVLESFSSTLEAEDRYFLNEIITWVTCAQKPLSLLRIDWILKMYSPEGDGMLLLEDALRKRFAALFTLTREDGLTTADLQAASKHRREYIYVADGENVDLDDELDDGTEFLSDPSTTVVSFCHASIGDFFRDKSRNPVSAGGDDRFIGINYHNAQVQCVKFLLQHLCKLSPEEKKGGRMNKMQYAVHFWIQHLRAVDFDRTVVADKVQIGAYLATLLQQGGIENAWARGATWQFFTKENVELCSKWLENRESMDVLPEKDKLWVLSNKDSPAGIFIPVAKVITECWLASNLRIPHFCFFAVHAAKTLAESGIPIKESDLTPEDADSVWKVACWFEMEHNALWHRRLAMVLRYMEMYDEAMEEFEEALAQEPNLLNARAGILNVHKLREEHEKVISLGKNLLLLREEELSKEKDNPILVRSIQSFMHKEQEMVAQSYESLGNAEEALECFQKGLIINPQCNTCILSTIGHLLKKKQFKDIVEILKSREYIVPGEKYTRLSELLWNNQNKVDDFYDSANLAALETGELTWLQKVYESAIIAAEKALKTVVALQLELCLADIYFMYQPDIEKAERLWEKLAQLPITSTPNADIASTRAMASESLAIITFDKAMQAGRDSPEANLYIEKLRKLSISTSSARNENKTTFSHSFASIVLGMWYRLGGQLEEAEACFRPYIKQALDFLSDDDLTNNLEGCTMLFNVLVKVGDDENSIALVLLIYSSAYMKENNATEIVSDEESLEIGASEGTEGRGGNKKTPGELELEEDISCTCDNPTCKENSLREGFNVCSICLDGPMYCDSCLKGIRERSLPFRVCDPSHRYLSLKPPSKRIPEGMILVGDALITFEEWKENLKKKWKI